MNEKTKTLIVAFFALLTLTSLNTSAGSSTPMIDDKAVDQKSLAIISGIYGIDLSKYQVIVNASGISPTATQLFGPNATQEFGDYTLVNSESTIYFGFQFVNGYLWYCSLNVIKGKPIYAPTVSTDIISQSKTILSNYQTFAAQNYPGDTAYITQASNILKAVSELKNTTLTSSEAKMEIKNSEHTSFDSINEPKNFQLSQIEVYFSKDGIDYPSKTLSLHFLNGNLNDFGDTWNIVSIGAPNMLTRQEALDMAWTAANNFNLSFISEDGSIFEEKPDLTNTTVDIHLSYTLKNSTQLRPQWFIYYYFNESIQGNSGIQVTIWGDTKEIYNCQALTNLGTQDNTSNTLPSDLLPSQPERDDKVWFVAFGAIVAIITIALIVWKKQTKKSLR